MHKSELGEGVTAEETHLFVPPETRKGCEEMHSAYLRHQNERGHTLAKVGELDRHAE